MLTSNYEYEAKNVIKYLSLNFLVVGQTIVPPSKLGVIARSPGAVHFQDFVVVIAS